jgi:hypothetical protein
MPDSKQQGAPMQVAHCVAVVVVTMTAMLLRCLLADDNESVS